MNKAVIFDIDGTLADCNHRRHHVEGKNKDWQAFFSLMHLDEPNKAVAELCHILYKTGITIILVSGRSEDYRDITLQWLIKHSINSHYLFMRPSKDKRPDTTIKQEILDGIKLLGHDILFAVEDRKSVVDMWRKNGITCLQCAEGDF